MISNRFAARSMRVAQAMLLLPLLSCSVTAQSSAMHSAHSTWRNATEEELMQALPARAPVQKERIETEMRTASGILDDSGHLIAGVVLITAGYSADGKYSHYLVAGSPIRFGATTLPTGKYVIGWKRVADGLDVHFFDAATGDDRGSATAHQMPAGTRVEPFRLVPPGEHAVLQIGRFGVPYALP